MNVKTALVAGVVIVAIAGGGYYLMSTLGHLTSMPGATAGSQDFTYGAMPMGITIEPLGAAQGYGPQRLQPSSPARNEIVYANDKGLTLYTYDKDEVGKSNCTADCAKTWIPVQPSASAKPVPNWTIIDREDGTKQWARKGKPLYTFVKDTEGGEVGGGGPGTGGGAMAIYGYEGTALKAKLPEGWHTALFQTGGVPTTGVEPPFGMIVKEVADANAVALVDSREMTIYTFDGDVNNDKLTCSPGVPVCTSRFTPVAAPQLAESISDWTFTKRSDGIRQWAYKGKPLYTYDGDLTPGDVNGAGVDKRWHVAAIQSYFLPSNVSLQTNPGRGLILATADGRTLYRRDLDGFNPASHQLGHDRPYRSRIGRTIQKTACSAECAKTWHPYLAPADAQPNAYWNVITLADGTKQWTYKDYGLFTYDGDKKPGDMTGDEIYDISISDDPNKVNDVGFPVHGPAGLYWSYAAL